MDTTDAASVAMEFTRVIVLEDDMSYVRVILVLGSLGHCGSVDRVDALLVCYLDDVIRIELSFE